MPSSPRPRLASTPSSLRLAASLLAALAAGSGAAAQGSDQPPTVVEAVCLEGGRSARLCACAEQRMFERLGKQAYAQYEAVAQAYLTRPKAGWPAAAADVAAITGGEPATILTQTKTHGRAHRDEMKACAAVISAQKR